MFNFYRLVFLISIMTISFNSFAAVSKLITATNEEDKDLITLSLIVDKNVDVTGLNMKVVTPQGKAITNKNFKVQDVYTGFTLMEKKGRKVVQLNSKNFSGHNGGEVNLDYLYSGISGKRGSIQFDLSRNGDNWVISYKGKKIKKLHFVSNKKFAIGTIGVKKIIVK